MAGSIWNPGTTAAPAIPFAAQVQFIPGLVGVPGISFVGSLSTGIWQSAPSQLDFTIGGVNSLHLDTNGLSLPTGKIIVAPELSLASAATCDIGSVLSNSIQITGTNNITSFGNNYRGPVFVRFAGALIISPSSNLITPGNAPLNVQAGDSALLVPKATGGVSDGWAVIAYQNSSPALSNVVSINGGAIAGFRNRIINGNMHIDQRNEGGIVTVPATVRTMIADRNYIYVTGAPTTAFQTLSSGAEGVFLHNVIQVNGAAGVASAFISQGIISTSSRDFAGKTCTLSVWAFQNTGVPMSVASPLNRFITTDVLSTAVSDISLTLASAVLPSGVWTKLIATGIPTSAAVKGMEVSMLAIGALPAGTFIQFAKFQFEQGPVASAFELRPYEVVMMMCQAYYEKSFPRGTKPAQNLGTVASGAFRYIAGRPGLAFEPAFVPFATTKRATPNSVVGYCPAAASNQVYDSSAFAVTSGLGTTAGQNGIYLSCNGAAGTLVGGALDWAWTVDAEIT